MENENRVNFQKPLTSNNKLNNFLISPQYINCSAFILPRVIECRVYYIKPPAITHFHWTISQGAVHLGPGHRRLRVADGRAVKSSSLVLCHRLCRWYKHYRKRRISPHLSGSHCSCWGIVIFNFVIQMPFVITPYDNWLAWRVILFEYKRC